MINQKEIEHQKTIIKLNAREIETIRESVMLLFNKQAQAESNIIKAKQKIKELENA